MTAFFDDSCNEVCDHCKNNNNNKTITRMNRQRKHFIVFNNTCTGISQIIASWEPEGSRSVVKGITSQP